MPTRCLAHKIRVLHDESVRKCTVHKHAYARVVVVNMANGEERAMCLVCLNDQRERGEAA